MKFWKYLIPSTNQSSPKAAFDCGQGKWTLPGRKSKDGKMTCCLEKLRSLSPLLSPPSPPPPTLHWALHWISLDQINGLGCMLCIFSAIALIKMIVCHPSWLMLCPRKYLIWKQNELKNSCGSLPLLWARVHTNAPTHRYITGWMRETLFEMVVYHFF